MPTEYFDLNVNCTILKNYIIIVKNVKGLLMVIIINCDSVFPNYLFADLSPAHNTT